MKEDKQKQSFNKAVDIVVMKEVALILIVLAVTLLIAGLIT